MAGKVESVSVVDERQRCALGSGCPHEHSSMAVGVLVKGLVLVTLAMTAVIGLLSWQVATPGLVCGQGGCVVMLRQWIWMPRGEQPQISYGNVRLDMADAREGAEALAEPYSGAEHADSDDYAEEELRRTHVDAASILEALQRGENADQEERVQGNKPVLVAEIRRKSEDQRADSVADVSMDYSGDLKQSAASRVNVVQTLSRINIGAVDGVDYLANLMKEDDGPRVVIRKAHPGMGRRIYIRDFVPKTTMEGAVEGEPLAAGVKGGRKISIGGDGAVSISMPSKEPVSASVTSDEDGESEQDMNSASALLKEEAKEVEEEVAEDEQDAGNDEDEAAGAKKETVDAAAAAAEDHMFVIRRIPGWVEKPVVEYPDEERPAVRVVGRARRMGQRSN